MDADVLLAMSELEEDEPVAGHCHFKVALELAVDHLHLHLEARLAELLFPAEPAEETQGMSSDLLLLLEEADIWPKRILVKEGERCEFKDVVILLCWLFLHLQPNLLSN